MKTKLEELKQTEARLNELRLERLKLEEQKLVLNDRIVDEATNFVATIGTNYDNFPSTNYILSIYVKLADKSMDTYISVDDFDLDKKKNAKTLIEKLINTDPRFKNKTIELKNE